MGFLDNLTSGISGGSLLSAGASALGGLMKNSSSAKQAQAANEMNRENMVWQSLWNADQAAMSREFESAQAERQMEFQNASNAKQMDFQQRMSSTAHQREVEDLRAAGLNPILSGTGGMGSSSPVGASSAGGMARGHQATAGAAAPANVAQIVDYLTPAIASAVSVGQVVSSVEKQAAETDLTRAQEADQRNKTAFRNEYESAKVDQEIKTLKADGEYKNALAGLTTKQESRVTAEIAELIARGKSHIASAAHSYAGQRNLDEKTRQEKVDAAAAEWAQEQGFPEIKKTLELAGLGSGVAKDLAQSILSLALGKRGVPIPKPSSTGKQINPYLKQN